MKNGLLQLIFRIEALLIKYQSGTYNSQKIKAKPSQKYALKQLHQLHSHVLAGI